MLGEREEDGLFLSRRPSPRVPAPLPDGSRFARVGGKREPTVAASGVGVADMGVAVVRFGYRLDDGEAEAASAAASTRIAAGESVEGVGEEVSREAGPVVSDVELDVPVSAGGLQRDLVAAVAERVVDEVAERLFEPHSVAGDSQPVRVAGHKVFPQLGGAPLETAPDRVEERVHQDGLDPKR